MKKKLVDGSPDDVNQPSPIDTKDVNGAFLFMFMPCISLPATTCKPVYDSDKYRRYCNRKLVISKLGATLRNSNTLLLVTMLVKHITFSRILQIA